jgi:hypothetical protein
MPDPDLRQQYSLTAEQAQELMGMCNRVGQHDINEWWAARGREQGFAWQSGRDLVWDCGGEPNWEIRGATFTAESLAVPPEYQQGGQP